MGRLIKGIFILFSLILMTAAIIKYNQPSFEHTMQKNPDLVYAEEIGGKLQQVEFTQKIIVALRAAGYSPDSTIGYLIESPNNQVVTIQLHNLEEFDKSTESEIQYIVNTIAKNNNLQMFIVDVKLIDAH
ncbi:hypothetical protein [Lysinibacillus xylanilyticus]|uniref:hypothetical protein n=1 Tax=Lysinibacillus xylanilyticus TaxID=582475 RepID=UPI003CFEF5A5